jgi:hypothetical protein
MAATIADMQRRLQILEATTRVGLNRAVFSWSTADAVAVSFSPSFDNGGPGTTWAASDSSTGTGYPRVTITHGKKVIIIVQASFQDVANDAAFRSAACNLGSTLPGGMSALPSPVRRITFGPTTEGNKPGIMISARADYTPGTHTFTTSLLWDDTNPAALNQPKLISPFLAVIPID